MNPNRLAPSHRVEPWALLAGAGTVLLTALLALPGDVPGWERALFRPVNDLQLPYPPVWLVMQLGNLVAVLVVALGALALRRLRLTPQILVGGLSAYVLAKVLKGLVDRPRPGALLTDVHLHGAASVGRGFPSGHAAVALALTSLLWPELSTRMRFVVAAAAVSVCLARMYVGAHLPLDVLGGAALGVACATAVRMAWPRRP
ncbi:MAG: Serine/threonine protein kinase [Frankiales bacterium]|nr:Serine/threonine protein kinase [Frankiales bacterium]